MGADNASMPAMLYLGRMDDVALCSALDAQDAAEALIALSWPVLPHGPDMAAWIIGDTIWTDFDLMRLTGSAA